jgi:multiple sugar transport system permease protein
MAKKYKLMNMRNTFLFHLWAILLGFVMLYPILWIISCSFKPTAEIFNSFTLIPKNFTLQNYVRGWAYNNNISFAVFFRNSFIVSVLTALGAVLSSSIVAYGFSRIHFPGNGFLYACMFLTLMLPYQVVMIPQYIIYSSLGWVNTILPLIVPQFCGQAFFIFLMVQFIRGIPLELDQSAMIDGCNRFIIFGRIIFPLIKPALVTSVIFSFYWSWDDFLGPLLYLNQPRLFTVSLALRMFSDPQTSTDWGAIFAMGTLSLLPPLTIFLLFQKYIIEGLVTSGIKG